ncbi:uncharacterized protein LOC124203631 [Daphnia pulex]|uniref:uncharacterized protein LOC124203631 n=1 Tax=Daphnia pulex TaxID=6669 RepID=UPI001EDE2478|nr:uncharacterized protein LOC124203631 [Daphnia pulex]
MDSKAEENRNQRLVSPPCFVNPDLDKIHNPDCQKIPSSCRCSDKTAWIWASSPDKVKSVRWGMWILFVEKKNVDKIWSEIVALLSNNQLGNVAKVSTADKRGDMHAVCLYTYDFKDVPDVFRVLVTLRRMNHLENGPNGTIPIRYATEENDVEEAVNGAGIPMYISPPAVIYEKKESIKMHHLLKIGPDSKVGLVAELRRNSVSEDIIKFYNPPIDIKISSSVSRPCKYDELIDIEDEFHDPLCDKQPSTCCCKDVEWIWAYQLVRVKPIHRGKWMLFPKTENVDEIWEKVKILVAANRLGNIANCSRADKENIHVICVFTKNFEDVKDVFRVLVTLRRNCLQNTAIHYKTDEATEQGVYKTDEAAKRAGFDSAEKLKPGQRVSMYFSPPSPNVSTGATETIQLFLNNIGPRFDRGLVAELRKEPDELEDKIIFYNPPRIHHPLYPSGRYY